MIKIGLNESAAFLKAQYDKAYPVYQKLLEVSVYQMPYFKDLEYKMRINSYPLQDGNNVGTSATLYDKYGVKKGLCVRLNPYCVALSSDTLNAFLLGHEIMHHLHNDNRRYFLTNYILRRVFRYEDGNDTDNILHQIVQHMIIRGTECHCDIMGILLAKKAGYNFDLKSFREFYQYRFNIEEGQIDRWKYFSPCFGLLNWEMFFEEIHPKQYEVYRYVYALSSGVYPKEYGFRYYNLWDMEKFVCEYMFEKRTKEELIAYGNKMFSDSLEIIREIMEINRVLHRQLMTITDYYTLLAIWAINYNYAVELKEVFKEKPKVKAYKPLYDLLLAVLKELQEMLLKIEVRIIGSRTREELSKEWEEVRIKWVDYRYIIHNPVPYTSYVPLDYDTASKAFVGFMNHENSVLRAEK